MFTKLLIANRGERIIAAAKDTDCEAIHPGYGFLSARAGTLRP